MVINEKNKDKVPKEYDFEHYSLTKKYRMYGVLSDVEKRVKTEVQQ